MLADPPPQALVEALSDSNLVIRFIGWVDQRAADFLKVRSEAIRRVKEALDAAGQPARADLPGPAATDRGRGGTAPRAGTIGGSGGRSPR